jgi:hypothetical protein
LDSDFVEKRRGTELAEVVEVIDGLVMEYLVGTILYQL